MMKKFFVTFISAFVLFSASPAFADTVFYTTDDTGPYKGVVKPGETGQRNFFMFGLDAPREVVLNSGISAVTKMVFTFALSAPQPLVDGTSALNMWFTHMDSYPILYSYSPLVFTGEDKGSYMYTATYDSSSVWGGTNESSMVWFTDFLLHSWQWTVMAGTEAFGDVANARINEVHLTLYSKGPAATPAPAAVLLLCSGLAGLGFARRRMAA